MICSNFDCFTSPYDTQRSCTRSEGLTQVMTWWKQHVSPKRSYLSTKLHNVKSQKIAYCTLHLPAIPKPPHIILSVFPSKCTSDGLEWSASPCRITSGEQSPVSTVSEALWARLAVTANTKIPFPYRESNLGPPRSLLDVPSELYRLNNKKRKLVNACNVYSTGALRRKHYKWHANIQDLQITYKGMKCSRGEKGEWYPVISEVPHFRRTG